MAKDISIELTDRIERMDALEDRLGIELEDLFAVYENDGYFIELLVNFDLVAASGKIDDSLEVNISVYNRNVQLVAIKYTYASKAGFIGCPSHSV
ncbi:MULTISPECIES: hypothetical protein [Rhodococcus]|uniref:Uncharacterized protein n=1 Tax=Rhodococcus qingshengii JCM 15477 TaxID=1303681 RepID=A0AB38RMU4_RHOSG|nr:MULTISPECIES: hypothetical protein [Rhodococcus]MDA3635408.1 hypothetical protein [Rhodococcus sp. C-2]UPU46695.1 hypothetical protein M0639_31280 [Rhodococcus qingshengii JCM 15477]